MGESPFKKVKFSINEEFMKEYLTCQIKKKIGKFKVEIFLLLLSWVHILMCGEEAAGHKED